MTSESKKQWGYGQNGLFYKSKGLERPCLSLSQSLILEETSSFRRAIHLKMLYLWMSEGEIL